MAETGLAPTALLGDEPWVHQIDWCTELIPILERRAGKDPQSQLVARLKRASGR